MSGSSQSPAPSEPSPPAPRPARRSSRGPWIALGAVVVVIVVVLVVLLSGIVPGWNLNRVLGRKSSAPSYDVVFTEAGLPSGKAWSVTLGGVLERSSGTTVTYSEPDGTYAYKIGGIAGFFATPPSGSAVVDGAAVSVSIAFAQTVYTVGFAESGLPRGTTFEVTLNGTAMSTTTEGRTGAVAFSVPNGTYAYSITQVPGWLQPTLPYQGSVVVNGAAVTEPTLTYEQITYYATFTETGLPTGTTWSITFNGSTSQSTTSTIVFVVPNGTYDYSVGAVTGYDANLTSGSVTVNGLPTDVAITFTAVPTSYELGMTVTGSEGSGTTWDDILELSPTSGLETSYFGLKVTTPSETVLPVETANGSACTVSSATNVPTGCRGTPGGWYGVLVGATGYIIALYTSAGWTYVSGTSITLTNADSLWVVTAVQVAGNGYVISAYSTGASSVSGSADL